MAGLLWGKVFYHDAFAGYLAAKESIHQGQFGTQSLKDKLIKMVKKRWNRTFNLISKAL